MGEGAGIVRWNYSKVSGIEIKKKAPGVFRRDLWWECVLSFPGFKEKGREHSEDSLASPMPYRVWFLLRVGERRAILDMA